MIATAGEPFASRLRGLGAQVTPYGEGMVERVRDLAGGAPDLVLHFYLAVKSGGALGYIVASTVFGPKWVRFFSAAPLHATMAALTQYVEAAALRPVVHSVYPLADIATAQRSLEAGGGRGKRVLDHVG